ncbi:glycosyltransferase family 4 protein [Bacillus daqingensis]
MAKSAAVLYIFLLPNTGRIELLKLLQKEASISFIGSKSNEKEHYDYETNNITFIEVPVQKNNINLFKEVLTFISTIRILKKANLNSLLVYGVRSIPLMVFSAKIAGVNNIVCVINGAGNIFRNNKKKYWILRAVFSPLLKIAFKFSKIIIFQNKEDLNLFVDKKMVNIHKASLVNGSGVNLNKFKFRKLPREFSFVMISRLSKEKGVYEFLHAAKKIRKEYPRVNIKLAGPIEDKALERTIIEANNNSVIEYIGVVQDVYPLLINSSIFVLPSYFEGTPRSTLEAMAVGRPIITTDTPGCRSTVNGKNGILVKPQNEKDLYLAMKRMISIDGLPNMALESRKLVESKFNIKEINQKIVNHLLE